MQRSTCDNTTILAAVSSSNNESTKCRGRSPNHFDGNISYSSVRESSATGGEGRVFSEDSDARSCTGAARLLEDSRGVLREVDLKDRGREKEGLDVEPRL
jgi:hypothetical protein